MALFTVLKKNFIAIERKGLTDEQKQAIYHITTQAITWDDGFFIYLRDPKQSFKPTLPVHQFLYEEETSDVCTGCKDRLKFITSGKACEDCFFHPAKKYASTRFNEKAILKTLVELGLSETTPLTLYTHVLPKAPEYVSGDMLIDKTKFEEPVLVNQKFLTIPYWRFGSSDRFIENVEVQISLTNFNETDAFGKIRLSENGFHGHIECNNLSNKNEKSFILTEMCQIISPYLYKQPIDTSHFPITFYSHTNNYNHLFTSTIEPITDLQLILETKDAFYYTDRHFVYQKLNNDVETFLSNVSNYRNFQISNKGDELFVIGNKLYKKLGVLEDIRFFCNMYNHSVLVSFEKRSSAKTTLREALRELKNTPYPINTGKLPIVYAPELVGEATEDTFTVGDEALIIFPHHRNRRLINTIGEIISIEKDTVTVGFLNNHFTETFDLNELFPLEKRQ